MKYLRHHRPKTNRRTSAGLRFVILASVFLAGDAVTAEETAPADSSSLATLQNYLREMQNLSADFDQSVLEAGSNEVVEQASGSVKLSKPGRFRWDYTLPFERVIVADGQRLWFYEADLEQVTVRRMSTGLGDTPAALLTGDVTALEQFEMLGSWEASGLAWFRLAPLSAEADFAVIEIGFDERELRRIEFVDRLGQRTRLTLFNIERPGRFAENQFAFEIPAGVDVIGEDEL